MKSFVFLQIASLLPCLASASEKDFVIRDIKIICEDDDPATDVIQGQQEGICHIWRIGPQGLP